MNATPNQFEALAAESAEAHFALMTPEEEEEYQAYLDSLRMSEQEPEPPEDLHLDAFCEG